MYDRILVPLDGAKFSEEILPHVAGLASVHGTALTLLRVVDKESDKREAQAYTKVLADQVSAQGICLVARGDVADAILEEARRVPDTLVAMTSHGRSGLLEAVLGSVALRVMRSGGSSVLVYRPSGAVGHLGSPVKVNRVVLPLDGTSASEAMAAQAAELAKWLGAELVVVGVIEPSARVDASIPMGDVAESSYVRSRASEYAAKHGVRVTWEVLHGEPADAIVSFVKGRSDAILAMATRGRSAVQSVFLGSVTAACLRKAGVPMLVRAP